jgi:hypothetical protein
MIYNETQEQLKRQQFLLKKMKQADKAIGELKC